MTIGNLFFTASAIFAAFILASVAFGLVSADVKEAGMVVQWLGHSVYFIPFPG